MHSIVFILDRGYTDGMLDSFDPISKQLRLMSSIVQYEDPELTAHLERSVNKQTKQKEARKFLILF